MTVLILPSARDDLSERFPYAVYYDLECQAVRVWAVLDCRRDPNEIRKKLAGLRRS
jgi:hypothetical protein